MLEGQFRRAFAEAERKKSLADEIAATEAAEAAEAQAASDQSEAQRYARAIKSSITAVFNYPPGTEEGLRCTLQITLMPGGDNGRGKPRPRRDGV